MNELKLPTNLETISLNERTNYRLIEINKIKNYFESEVREQRKIFRRLSKHVTGLDCTDKVLTGFLTIFSGVNLFSHIKDKSGLVTSIFSLKQYVFLFLVLE